MASLSAAAIGIIGECDPQNLSNTLWSFAVFVLGSSPLIDSFAAQSLSLISDFAPQEISNTAWAIARLVYADETLLAALASAAMRKLTELSLQDMTNIPWSFANLSFHHDPLLTSIASAAIANIAAFGQPVSAPMLLWTLWKASLPATCLSLFDNWSVGNVFSQPEPFGLMLMDNDWWKDVGWELDLLNRMQNVLPIRSVHVALVKLGFSPSLPMNSLHPGLRKVAQLVDEVEGEVTPGRPQDILAACEHFAKYKGQWLKVAGLEKAEILEAGYNMRPLQAHELIMEFGVYVGYTAVRLGAMVADSRRCIGAISLEVSPVHVCVARHLLDLGELAHVSEVKSGQAKDALPRVSEELGDQCVGFSFMDHRGTIFHQDFALLEQCVLFAKRSRFVADNTLNPGAPVFLWIRQYFCTGGSASFTTQWAITEFLSDHEDWTAVCDIGL